MLKEALDQYLETNSDTTNILRMIESIQEMQSKSPLASNVPIDYLFALSSEYSKIIKNIYS